MGRERDREGVMGREGETERLKETVTEGRGTETEQKGETETERDTEEGPGRGQELWFWGQ